jgi:CDI immunity proteins
MSQKARTIADQTLDELEGVEWGPPAYDSALAANVHRLRRVPLKQYRLEDLRLMIAQQVGVTYLVPRALDRLEAHPLAAGDFHPGDVLAAVARLPDGFWSKHRQLLPRALRAIDAALARLHEVDTADELHGELRAARDRLAALHGGPTGA